MDEKTIERLRSKIVPTGSEPPNAKVLLFGNSGVGKTTAASIAPKPLVVDCEGGTLALNKINQHKKLLDIQTIKPSGFRDMQELFWYLRDGKHDRQTVIIDSLTEVQAMSMDDILADPKRDDKFDRDTPVLQDYGKNTNVMRKLVRAFRDLPMNVVFTCLSTENKDDSDGSLSVVPALTPKLANDVMGYVDVVGYMFVADKGDGKTTRKMLTQPKGKYTAKDRSGRIGKGMEEPTMFNILHTITGGAVELPSNLKEIMKEVQNNEG